jgi:hypothetical protein
MKQWGDDSLSKFLSMAHTNQQGNCVKFAGRYETISKIDDCLVRAGKNLVNPKPVMAGVLLLRCQYAFKTAAGLALAGQVVEAFVMARSVLEYAGYAAVIHGTPALEAVFINRHQSAAEMKAQKEAFKISQVRARIAALDAKLAEIFDEMYQRAIDFGGHPNPHGTFSAMALDEKDGTSGITTLAFTVDQAAVEHALKSVAQAGLAALYIFQHVFKEKFELLGIRAAIDALRQGGGL